MDFKDLSFESAPLIKTPLPGPGSKIYLDYQSQNEGNAVSYPRGLPMAIKRGRGATLEDVDGNIYIDCFGGAGVINVGHSNPAVIDAAKEQLKDFTHSLDIPNPPRKKMVENLRKILPDELTRIFFGAPTGSDAVESAIKLAKYNTKKYPVIAFEGSYHGMTSTALSLCSGDFFKEDFLPLIPEIHFAPYAYCYRCPFKKAPDNCEIDCALYLEHILEDPHSGVSHPAAIIVEAIQGEGGSIVPHEGFIPKLRGICDKYEVLLIIDEIQAGFCRTGSMFSFEHTGTVPDIMTMSKALGGVGFPISAIAYKERLDTWTPGKHIGTFRGNVIAYAGGAAGIDFMLNNDLAKHTTETGNLMLDLLKETERNSDFIGEARGKGLMLGVEFVMDKETKEPAPEFASKVRSACHKRGVLIEIGGHYFNVARFLPPLVITADLARKAAEIFADAVKDVEKNM
ncbi:aspartate aminotransferase family protein [candidate division KSB1 bacterium]